MADKKSVVPTQWIESLILIIRGQRVMLDADLAALYGVSTKRFNEQVKRNIDRFPEDFMFQLTQQEKAEVVANCDHLGRLKFSPVCLMPLPNMGRSWPRTFSSRNARSKLASKWSGPLSSYGKCWPPTRKWPANSRNWKNASTLMIKTSATSLSPSGNSWRLPPNPEDK